MRYTLLTAISLCVVALWLVIQGASRHAAPAAAGETASPPRTTKAARERATAQSSAGETDTNQRFRPEAARSGQRGQLSASPSPPSGQPGHTAHDVRKSRLAALAVRSEGATRGEASTPAWLAIKPAAARTASPLSPTSPYGTPQPAALVDMGDALAADPARDAALQEEAERLAEFLANEADSGNPRAFGSIPKAVADDSDIWFRQRFGGWQWMQHHIQARHLAASAE
jgi:hypothetical protein